MTGGVEAPVQGGVGIEEGDCLGDDLAVVNADATIKAWWHDGGGAIERREINPDQS